jgi:hypothetical protein
MTVTPSGSSWIKIPLFLRKYTQRMKLLRKRFIVTGLLLVVLVGGVYGLKLFLEQEKRLEHLVIQTVSPYIKGTFQVGRVRLGFFSAHLNGVRVKLSAQALGVSIDDIRIDFSPVKLFLSGFSAARSIGKIVLVGPTIEISIAASAVSETPQPFAATSPVQMSRYFAVQYLFVKNGTIKLKDRRGQVAILGEQLQGRMWDSGTELDFNMTGKLGAVRRNLFVSGRISWCGEQHHLSLKLDKAEIQRPIAFRDVVISSGMLTGILEFAFPDTVSFANIESNGWVRIQNGTCLIGAQKKKFKSVDLSTSISGAGITLDSLAFLYSGARFHANGSWDLSGKAPSDRIDFQCQNLLLDSLGFKAAKVFCRIVGAGSIRGTLERKRGSDISLSLNSGGVTIWRTPLLCLFAHVNFQRGQLEFDSLSLRSPAVTINGKGIIDYSREPLAYEFQGNGSFDSLGSIVPGFHGRMQFTTDLNGIGKERSGQIILQGRNIQYSGIPLGRVAMAAQIRNDSSTFFIHNEENGCKVEAGGVVRRLFTGHSSALCTLSMKVNAKSPFFMGKLEHWPRPESFAVKVFFGGWSDTFNLQSTVDIKDKKVKGGLILTCERGFSQTPLPVAWKLEPLNLLVAGVPSSCSGSGDLYQDSLTIDSLVLFDRAVVSGKFIRKAPFSASLACSYDVAVKNIAALLMKSADAVESGRVHGTMRLSGPFDKIESRGEVHVRDLKISGIGTLETDATVIGSAGAIKVLPLVIRKDGKVIATLDTLWNSPCLHCAGKFDNIDISAVFGAFFSEETKVDGRITGSFCSSEKGFPVILTASSPRISVNGRKFDSARAEAAIDTAGVRIRSLSAGDSLRSVITAKGFVPLSFLRGDQNEKDTLSAVLMAKGDLIASFHNNVSALINGSGQGLLSLSIDRLAGNWHVKEGSFVIPKGTLIFKPYLYQPVKDFSCNMAIKDSTLVNVLISGITAGKRPVRIFSTHEIPKGYNPVIIGPLDFGILQIETYRHGLDVHLPGFMEKGETGDLEPVGASPFMYFSLAGPVNNPTVHGGLLLRNLEFTYPLLEEDELRSESTSLSSNPSILSQVRWELDVKAADRKVMYFRDISGNNTRLIRLLDAYIDEGSSEFHLRGCNKDNTLKITGTIKSYHGAVYYGKTFDRNLEAGLEFVPQKKNNASSYDNWPVLWGSAEAYSDTSRFDRIKLTAVVQDPATGSISERGRMGKGRNVVFRLSSDFEEMPGASERAFYRQAGLQFTTFGGAGKMVSDFGEQNLHRIFLQRFERKLAKLVGLDVISIETSIASNYFTRFYGRQFVNQTMQMQADYLALANAGLTIGHYLLNDMFFVKASGGFLPFDTSITPQYAIGLEFQPTRYLFMNFDYGFYKRELVFEHNPRVNLQLRLPITGLRNLFDF